VRTKKPRFVAFNSGERHYSGYYPAKETRLFHYQPTYIKGQAVLDQKTGIVYVVYADMADQIFISGSYGVRMVADTVEQQEE
jgi:hypothetical protein